MALIFNLILFTLENPGLQNVDTNITDLFFTPVFPQKKKVCTYVTLKKVPLVLHAYITSNNFIQPGSGQGRKLNLTWKSMLNHPRDIHARLELTFVIELFFFSYALKFLMVSITINLFSLSFDYFLLRLSCSQCRMRATSLACLSVILYPNASWFEQQKDESPKINSPEI